MWEYQILNSRLMLESLPIHYHTPTSWAESVLGNPLALLCDHAYLERKAASNALDLLNRWTEPYCPDLWAETLSGIAKDETAHLSTVLKLLSKRGGKLTRTHKSYYATNLRLLVRTGKGNLELLDRLLVSALIEVRSCERFMILAAHAQDEDLRLLYKNLFASEAGHYKVFLKLAEMHSGESVSQTRWQELLILESEIIAAQAVGSGLHSGVIAAKPS
jgi:tRNA 2-(methylsulfanyl)-N6-isopentenyladenosine37 hydroxylase